MKQLAIDIGYSSSKIKYNNQFHSVQSAIAFSPDTGINYGDDSIIEYKGERYVVGESAAGLESFVTTDFAFKTQFDPMIVYHILKNLDLVEYAKNGEIELFLTLALADWKFKEDYLDILKEYKIDGIVLKFNNITMLPQGAGVYLTYFNEKQIHPESAVIIDIGFNTINFLVYEKGHPKKAYSKGYSGHGVSTIIRQFATFLESTFNMPFSEAEALKIFTNNRFTFNGQEQPQVIQRIGELKNQFVHKLFSSILTSEKKILATSEVVIFAGGGCYLLEGIHFPPNVTFTNKPYEFANINSVI